VLAVISWLMIAGLLWAGETSGPPMPGWLPSAPPLDAPPTDALGVSNVDELFRAAEEVEPGGTILLADGHYMMPRCFMLSTDNVTVRSRSANRNKVILDGAQSRHGELVAVTACSGVTIADLTIQNIRHNGFKINSNRGVQKVTIHNCAIRNIWQRGVKGVRVPPGVEPPTDCRIAYCLFYNDRPKQFSDDSTDTPENFGGNYIGGIDVMNARRWIIENNVFVGIHGRTGEARGAVFLWQGAENCLVQRNVIIDCDSGICLGNSHRVSDDQIHCTQCIVRNNFLTRCPENGILADYTRDCAILHNTVHDPDSRLKRLIRVVHDNRGLQVVNNLLSGPSMRVETDDELQLDRNVTKVLTGSFVDAEHGDLHLKNRVPGFVFSGKSVGGLPGDDIDGQEREKRPDAGADEYRTPRDE
jgi:hypothetical protein